MIDGNRLVRPSKRHANYRGGGGGCLEERPIESGSAVFHANALCSHVDLFKLTETAVLPHHATQVLWSCVCIRVGGTGAILYCFCVYSPEPALFSCTRKEMVMPPPADGFDNAGNQGIASVDAGKNSVPTPPPHLAAPASTAAGLFIEQAVASLPCTQRTLEANEIKEAPSSRENVGRGILLEQLAGAGPGDRSNARRCCCH